MYFTHQKKSLFPVKPLVKKIYPRLYIASFDPGKDLGIRVERRSRDRRKNMLFVTHNLGEYKNVPQLLLNLYEFLQTHDDLWQRVDVFIVERQFRSEHTTRIETFLETYFLQFSGALYIAGRGIVRTFLQDYFDESIPNKRIILKRKCVEYTDENLESSATIRRYFRTQKDKFDTSDAFTQIDAFLYALGIIKIRKGNIRSRHYLE